MKEKIKSIFSFLLFLGIYILPSFLFPVDRNYYYSLNGWKVPPIVFIIAWGIIFVTMSLLNTMILKNRRNYNKSDFRIYFVSVFMNYLTIFFYPLLFFRLHNLFFSYICTLLCLCTGILVGMNAIILEKKKSILTLPLLLWSLFACVISILFYLNN